MLRVNVTGRNKGTPCERCGRKLGDIGTHAFVTHRSRGRRGAYCCDCGEKLQDSTVLGGGRQHADHADEKGFCHNALSPITSGNQAAPSQSRQTPRDTAPGKPTISMLPSTIHTQLRMETSPASTSGLKRRSNLFASRPKNTDVALGGGCRKQRSSSAAEDCRESYAGGLPEMNETPEVRCRDCGNRTDEKPPFCIWLSAEIRVGLADDPTCEGFIPKGVGKGRVARALSHKATSVKGDDERVGGAETSVDKPQKTTSYPKTDSASALKRPEKAMILTALELKKLKGSVVWEKVRCGKRNCRCNRGYLHGPFGYLHYYDAGRVRRRYLGKDLPVLVNKPREELEARLSQIEEILGQGGS